MNIFVAPAHLTINNPTMLALLCSVLLFPWTVLKAIIGFVRNILIELLLSDLVFNALLTVVYAGLVPDFILRTCINWLCYTRLEMEDKGSAEANLKHKMDFIEGLKLAPLAIHTDVSTEQHYELPTEFFLLSLGRRLKYSGCFFPPGCKDLNVAEEATLKMYCERAGIRDGMTVLDLGCGWGSLTLYLLEKYPNLNVVSVSHSSTQREFILSRRERLGVNSNRHNIITSDVNVLELPDNHFDRIVSVEMFEHMKNYQKLFASVSRWLKPDGKLFVHIFTHRTSPYHFEARSERDWMAKYFFTGGTMPSDDLFLYFQDDLAIEHHWRMSGQHYEKTANAWLDLMDSKEREIRKIFKNTYGAKDAQMWYVRWRLFYLACAEMFGFDNGNEWMISHYLFQKRTSINAQLQLAA